MVNSIQECRRRWQPCESTQTCRKRRYSIGSRWTAGNKERVRVVCDGREIAAVIPLEDLELLEELEDRLDVLEALDAIAEAKREGGPSLARVQETIRSLTKSYGIPNPHPANGSTPDFIPAYSTNQ